MLALSDSPFLNTGFSTITLNILNRLSDLGYDCNYLGQAIPHPQQLNMIEPYKFLKAWEPYLTPNGIDKIQRAFGTDRKYDFDRLPSVYLQDGTPFKFNLIGQAKEAYCKDIIQPWIKAIKPDIYFTLLDTFMCYPWYLDIDFSPAKSVFYYPSDGEPFLPGGNGVCDMILRKATKAIAMSKFAQNQVKSYHKLDTSYIPHAIDEKMFFPLSDEEKAQIRLKWGLKGKWVVGCLARNQPRKMMDRTVKAFAKFAKDKDDVVLVLHLDPYDLAAAFDINGLIRELGIMNKVLFTGVRYFQGFSYEQMNEVYNLFDVFCLLTSGEGFGIPVIEALSCEVPVVITDYTTSQELILEDGQCGEVVKLMGTNNFPRYDPDNVIFSTLTGTWNVERGLADIYDGAKMLNKLYYDRDLSKIYGKTGRRKVLRHYTWDIVIPQWHSLFQKMLND